LPADADKSLTRGKNATATSVAGNSVAMNALDGELKTLWAASAVRNTVLEVDLREPVVFGRCYVSEWNSLIRAFELQVLRDGNWETVRKGNRIGPNLEVTFAPIKAQKVRLNILDSLEGFAIRELMLFAPGATDGVSSSDP
jgi:alpha-L-fucosidase